MNRMIPYTKKYYLDTIEKGLKELVNCNSIPVGQLDEMVYMIGELKKDLPNKEVKYSQWIDQNYTSGYSITTVHGSGT